MSRFRVMAMVLCGIVLGASSLLGQKAPKRPRLPPGQDSNSAVAYYLVGHKALETDVEKAAAAFYWASRIDPGWAAPVYGRYVALLLILPQYDLTLFLTDREKARKDKHLARLDSMLYAATLRDPFVDRRLDAAIINLWLLREYGDVDMRDLGKYDRRFTAWAASARSDYALANKIYREEIERRPDDIDLRFGSGRNFFAQRQFDSALVAVRATLDLIRETDEDEYRIGWVPHEFSEYSVGYLHAILGHWDSASAAYERALLDDIKFAPAHRELAKARLAMRDTAGAIAEYSEAVTLMPNDGSYLYELGMLLMGTKQIDSASKMFQRATVAEPYFPLPYYPLGIIMEASGFTAEARKNYEQFLQFAPVNMTNVLANVRIRLERLPASP